MLSLQLCLNFRCSVNLDLRHSNRVSEYLQVAAKTTMQNL